MKVYSCPKSCPAPELDFGNYDHAKQTAAEEEHQRDLVKWLVAHGYTGKHTGLIYTEGVADGCAEYMLADGSKSFLIHLPYGDGYQSRNVEFIPKREIIKRGIARDKLNKMFSHA